MQNEQDNYERPTPEDIGDARDHEIRDRKAEDSPSIYALQSLSRECSGLLCRYKEHRDINTLEAMAARFAWLDAEARLTVMQLEYFKQTDAPARTELLWNTTEVSDATH